MTTENSATWKGVHISELRSSLNFPQFPEVVNKDDHTVLVQTPIIPGKVPDSFPSIFDKVDFWDANHVKLPCSDKNVTEDQIKRWSLIRDALGSVILSGQQLEIVLLSYNKRFAERWNFSTLRMFFDEVCDEEESAAFFQSLLPKMIDLALCLPELVTGGIPLLKHGRSHSITLSQMQIASLLANAFFITFPHRNTQSKGSEYANYPSINFTRLFQGVFRDRKKATIEKIKSLLHYFRRVTSSHPTGVVTYSRHFVPKLVIPDWAKSTKLLPKLNVSSTGTIEDEGFGLYQVDFAHKLIGGGVIANGCVQEEIRFVICPELILSRLFTECLEDNEALIITGCERFSKYKGYGKSFEWDGDYIDGTPSDQEGRKYCTVVAIDALFFRKNFAKEQYSPSKMNRELNKAYAGYSWGTRRNKNELCGIATGNWGCGVYRGNAEFKSLLQLMAAAESNRDLAYFTFGNDELRDSMHAVHEFLIKNKITIGKIYDLLCQYNAGAFYDRIPLYDYIKNEALSSSSSKKVVKPFPLFADLKRSLSNTSKKKVDRNNSSQTKSEPDNRTNSGDDDESPPVSKSTVDVEEKNMKCKESQMLMQMYQSRPTPSTSAANLSEDSDDSFDLDKYRKVKRSRLNDINTDDTVRSESEDETQYQPSYELEEETNPQSEKEDDNLEEDSRQIVSDSDEDSSQNFTSTSAQIGDDDETIERDHEDILSKTSATENTQEPSRDESDISENFEPAKNSPKKDTKTPLNSRSVPLKGLTIVSKKSKTSSNSSKKKFSCQKTKISHYFSPSSNSNSN
ncbi:poly(ADP-ribose) glycohydrolase-like [Planococcus citri]|uniref:poly(ADP-ribose) glycohydrolase-like n=1 Tax=Planococcus citri TaxID=170843 RepID=UPI0031F98B1E